MATAASAGVADVVLIIPYCIVGLIKREDTLIFNCWRECNKPTGDMSTLKVFKIHKSDT